MTNVYDKDGKEYKVKHSVDLKEWLEAGYMLQAPKKQTQRELLIQEATELGLEFEKNIKNVDLEKLILDFKTSKSE